MNAFKDVMA
jgi:hypothetical protein